MILLHLVEEASASVEIDVIDYEQDDATDDLSNRPTRNEIRIKR